MIEIIKIIFLGIVEGITEWLPISSTGHMIIVDEFLKLSVRENFKEMFFVVIQLGAIMAVVVLYFDILFPFEKVENSNAKSGKKSGKWKICPKTVSMWKKVLIASVPAAVVGLPLDDFLDEKFYNYKTVAIALIVYGLLFIFVEKKYDSKNVRVKIIEQLTIKDAITIGVWQVLALIPGTSRSGSTIIGGTLCGVSRKVIAEFTFFLAIPIMFGASLLKLVKYGLVYTGTEIMYLLLGMVVAFFVSIFAIKFLISYIKKNSFVAFGYYRVILGIIIILYFMVSK